MHYVSHYEQLQIGYTDETKLNNTRMIRWWTILNIINWSSHAADAIDDMQLFDIINLCNHATDATGNKKFLEVYMSKSVNKN